MAEGAVKAVVDKLEELAMQELKLQSQVGKEVRALKDDLEWVSTFLGDADCRRRREVNAYIELWVRQTREVAFDAEDLLEEFFHKGELHCRGCLNLPSLLSWLKHSFLGLFVRHSICNEVDLIKERLEDIKKKREEYKLQNLPTNWAPLQRHYYSGWHTFEQPTTLQVGINKNCDKIINWLHEKKRTVIAITGKSGIGKTTLASCIVESSSVRKEFECVVWVQVPEKYRLLELLNDIIRQVNGPTEKSNVVESVEKIRQELYEKLSGKKYLIILDDVRSLEEWKFILTVLPDEDGQRSGVIITTQIKSSVISDNPSEKVEPVKNNGLNLCNYLLKLKKLDQKHGKELLCKRVFGENTFPRDFWNSEKHSKNIERLLHASPLAITLLAGLLRSKREDEWTEVTNQILQFDKNSPTDTNSMEEQQEDHELQAKQQQNQEEEEREEEKQDLQGKMEDEDNKRKQRKQHQLQQVERKKRQQHEQESERKQEQKELSIHQRQNRRQKKNQEQQSLRIQYKQLHLMDKILMLSFDDLPPHLKQCFLYFAAFKAEVGIDSKKLIHLWVAEGFVQPTDSQTMEECGQHCLKMLISRCLINLVNTDYNNNIITVSIHERVLAFARSEARETNFIQVHNCTTNLSRTSIRRLSFQNTFDSHTILTLFAPKLRSMLCDIAETVGGDPIQGMDTDFPCTGNLWKITLEILKGRLDNSTIYRCKFLRVIDLKGVAHQHTLPKETGLLIHLRYLGLAHTSLRSLPKSVKKLCNLQTLDISNTRIKAIPQSFWKIKTLRHVQADSLENGPEEVDALNNLQTLHGVPWGPWAQNADLLKRLNNLQSLRAWKLSSNIVSSLTRLEFLVSLDLQADEKVELPLNELLTSLALCRLQYLRLQGKAAPAAELRRSYLLPNLTVLELCQSKLVQGHIDTIAKLPSLIELELGEDSYSQEEIKIPDDGFSELRKLKLNGLHKLKSLTITDHRSEQWGLQYVFIIHCKLLKTHEDLQKLKQLKLLMVDKMPNHFPSKCKIWRFTK